MTKQILAFLFCFTRELNPYTSLTFSLCPPIHPFLRPPNRPPLPPKKSLRQKHGAACTARMQPARSQRIASQTIRAPCSAAQRSATSSQRIGPRIASRASHRITSHPVQRSAPRECNQPARSALHRKQSAHRAAHRPHRQTARRALHAAHLAPAALRPRFAVLCAGFVWFVVLTFPKFNLYTSRIEFSLCFLSSVGSQL